MAETHVRAGLAAERLRDLSASDFARRLAAPGVVARIGPFAVRVVSPIADVARDFQRMYGDFPLADAGEVVDVSIELLRPWGLRRWLRPQLLVSIEGGNQFKPMPLAFGSAAFEWAFNLALAARTNQHLVVHAGVLARDDRAVALPAEPGAGKSTLSAALMGAGWRLLSDEAVVLADDDAVLAIPRPVMLKGLATSVIRSRFPSLEMTAPRPAPPDTEGPLCLLRPTAESVAAALVPARLRWVVFPRYRSGAALSVTELERGPAFMRLVENTVNYGVRGLSAFEQLGRIVSGATCHTLEYGTLDEALDFFDNLAREV